MTNDQDRFATWDAAYVLGALSATDRREFEGHLQTCARCTASVSELAGMPGLLAKVSPADALKLLDGESLLDGASPSAPVDLLPRLARAAKRHRRTRLVRAWGIGAAAVAAAIAGALYLPAALDAAPAAMSSDLQPVTETPLSADVRLTGLEWGTRVEMTCSYATDATWSTPQPEGGWSYALYVTDRSGATTLVSSWRARAGSVVETTGTIETPLDDIASVDVRAVASGSVLLQTTLD